MLSACTLPSIGIFTGENSISGSDASGSDVSSQTYEPSQRTSYTEDETGAKIINGVVSGGEIVENPWISTVSGGEGEGVIKRSKENKYENISVPTWFEHYDGLYFFVDCYHDQIVYNDNLKDPIYMWKVMDDKLERPHTIAFDGKIYMVDDTDENKIIAYRKISNEDGSIYFERIQEFVDMGERPHYIVYDDESGRFFAWSSKSGQMWVFKHSKDKTGVFLDESYNIPALNGVYVRSFVFIEDKVYFVSGTGGNCTIFEATADTFDVIREIPVAPEIGGMVQITKIEDYFYITVSTSLYGETELKDIIRTDSLEHLQVGQYESVYERLIGEFPGTPYNITHVDGKWCLTVHREGFGAPVVYFEVKDNEIVNVGTYY